MGGRRSAGSSRPRTLQISHWSVKPRSLLIQKAVPHQQVSGEKGHLMTLLAASPGVSGSGEGVSQCL